MKHYNIYRYGDHYELYIDGEHVGDFRTYREAANVAYLRGAEKTPRKIESDEGAPF